MNRRDKERLMKQIDREIDVENTKSALLGFGLGFLFIFAMIAYYIAVGY